MEASQISGERVSDGHTSLQSSNPEPMASGDGGAPASSPIIENVGDSSAAEPTIDAVETSPQFSETKESGVSVKGTGEEGAIVSDKVNGVDSVISARASTTTPPSAASITEFINSPRGQNDIEERSPGGRYLRFREKLGSGASKDVYRAYDTAEGIEVAWNVVNLAGVPKAERNRIVNEVRLLEQLHHHNIISFHGSWVNRERQEVNFVTEILSSGTLKSFIDKVQVIRWKIAKRWARQILKGLEYLHSQDPVVIHRDLKCENIFINGTSGDLRIGDLGLSTVHRNGKVLSVLGTPEFMAPDLYEEIAYDEKVDIYAFGMCLLEILTKEIPYAECSNPPQIFKKVLKGEPPQSLSRLRSKEARDFILLCLGEKGDDGKYIRPTATELLNHPFLAKGIDDDSEVEVDPPMQERVINESPDETSDVNQYNRPENGSNANSQTSAASANLPVAASVGMKSPLYIKESEDDSDKFDEMPDSEVNMKKVKVMEGRDRELEESDHAVPSRAETASTADVSGQVQHGEQRPVPLPSSQPAGESGAAESDSSQLHYLVNAAVIEDATPQSRPYPDDMLKLIVTLPVEGRTQNVQFDFHLVQDDPVKVAKEMVEELNIPKDAILEISETISALACTARRKLNSFKSTEPVNSDMNQSSESEKRTLDTPAQQDRPPESSEGPAAPRSVDETHPQPVQVHPGHEEKQRQQMSSVSSASVHTAAIEPKSNNVKDGQLEPQASTKRPLPNNNATSSIPPPRTVVPPEKSSGDQTSNAVDQDADAESDSDGESELTEQLRILDDGFQKNLQRAQKVFDTRMESLHRSKEEREAQHRKTLERHEKEKAEFERRLEAEAKEQTRRLAEMQKQWDEQRESLAKRRDLTSKRKPAASTEQAIPSTVQKSEGEINAMSAKKAPVEIPSVSHISSVPTAPKTAVDPVSSSDNTANPSHLGSQ